MPYKEEEYRIHGPRGPHNFTLKHMYDKGNNKITELRTILQRESQNS